MATSVFSDILSSVSRVIFPYEGPIDNILHKYATYNYIFTLSVMNKDMVNNPSDTYKKGKLGQVILKSGSGDPFNRVQLGDFGSYDFMIDDVHLSSIVAFTKRTGNTNVTNISFKIFEPYSMGMFFHALNIAANQYGYKNYISAPFLLTLEFVGNLGPNELGINGDSLHPIEKTTRHIPMKITMIEMDVNNGGTTYNVEAIPWNETAAGNTHAQIKDYISISGRNVQELLQDGPKSLQSIINKKLIKDAIAVDKDPDEILILFPKDPKTTDAIDKPSPSTDSVNGNNSTTVDPTATDTSKSKYNKLTDVLHVEAKVTNDITILVQKPDDVNVFGLSSMTFDAYTGKTTPFADDNFVYDDQSHIYTRGNLSVSVNENVGEMKFPQSSSIFDIINEVILMSSYGQAALKEAEVEKYKGKIQWWRIDLQSYSSPSDHNTYASGEPSVLQVYRVVPYMVNASIFLPPGKSLPDEHIKEMKKQAIKEYNYIYTGKNLDIISFDIKFKAALYQAMFDIRNTVDEKLKGNQATIHEQKKDQSSDSSESKKPDEDPSTIIAKLFDVNKLARDTTNIIRRIRIDALSTSTASKGGALSDTKVTKLTKQAHDIILDSKDMLNPTLKIFGDPYYLSDSGFGNYTAQETEKENINADHSMNYQNGEVDIIVNFRTPLDIEMATGIYEFGDTKIISQFSGLYQVLTCESNFSKGEFTQELKLLRRQGQNPESSGTKDESSTPVDEFGANENGRITGAV